MSTATRARSAEIATCARGRSWRGRVFTPPAVARTTGGMGGAFVAIRRATLSATVSEPRCSGGGASSATTSTFEQGAQVDVAVAVAADQVTDHAEDKGQEESPEAAGRGGDPEQKAGQHADECGVHV